MPFPYDECGFPNDEPEDEEGPFDDDPEDCEQKLKEMGGKVL